ncbi:MAG TPA: hypothetical protein VN619_05880 [Lacisediminihabitans sp.]|jgi:hypothetical protein|nr:hypothetical protein [Lacisediminihabitans sp.]HXD61435.1 hypothetical protein [Lacisediminihabitans sp.]
MNTALRRIVLAITAALGIFVGVWAAAFPDSFYSEFPGLGFIWVAVDGPFNEHLIRDVGGLYLAIAAATLLALFSRELAATRAVGVAWTVFGVLHLSYHASHLAGMSETDAIGELLSLSVSLVLGIILLLPARRPSAQTPDTTNTKETAQ